MLEVDAGARGTAPSLRRELQDLLARLRRDKSQRWPQAARPAVDLAIATPSIFDSRDDETTFWDAWFGKGTFVAPQDWRQAWRK